MSEVPQPHPHSGKEVITNDAFVRERPWPCCKDPLLVGRTKELVPLVAMCDRKAGHTGSHRGRLDGNTYFWRTLGAKKVALKRKRQREYIEKERARMTALPEIPYFEMQPAWYEEVWAHIRECWAWLKGAIKWKA